MHRTNPKSLLLLSLFLGFWVSVLGQSSYKPDSRLPDSVNRKILLAHTPAQLANAWLRAGNWYLDENHLPDAQNAAEKIIDLTKDGPHKALLAHGYNLKGIVLDYKGEYASAIEFYLKALNIREKLGNQLDIARSLNNVGSAYYYINSYKKAEEHYERTLKMFEKLKDTFNTANVSTNLGSVKGKLKKPKEALYLHRKAKLIYSRLADESSLAGVYINFSVAFNDLKQFDSSLYYLRSALAIHRKNDDFQAISECYSNLAGLYLDMNRPDSALAFVNFAIKLNKSLQSKEGLKVDYETMSQIQEKIGNFRSALDHYKKFVAISDTLVNQESREKIANNFVQFEFDKQRYTDSLQKAEEDKRISLQKELADQELERNMNIQYSGIVFFLMVVLGSIFLLRKVHLPIIWIEGFIFFTAILLFEFLYLILDPFIEKISGGMPIYKFGINMLLAVGIFYAHSFFETLLKHRLISNPIEDAPMPDHEKS